MLSKIQISYVILKFISKVMKQSLYIFKRLFLKYWINQRLSQNYIILGILPMLANRICTCLKKNKYYS